MRRTTLRVAGLLLVALIAFSALPHATTYAYQPIYEGGGGGGNSGGGKPKDEDPCTKESPPAVRRPEYQTKCYYIVRSKTWTEPEPPQWDRTNDWTWTYRVEGGYQGGIEKTTIEWAPGYPKNVDELSRTVPLRYDFVGSREGPYYIEDQYRDWLRYYYNQVRLERGRVTFRWLCWSRIWRRVHMREDYWNDGGRARYSTGETRSALDGPSETNPDSVCDLNPYTYLDGANLWDWISFSEDRPAIKAPPIDRPIPPSGIVPPPLWSWPLDYLGGREIIRRDYKYKDDWGKGGSWLFGGKPLSDPVSGIRGGFADIGIRAIAQGAPGGKQQVTSVKLRVLSPFPDSGWQYLGLWSGSHTDGIWRAMVPIPRRGVVLRPHRYTVEAVIEGFNFWGAKRAKVIRFQLVIDEGEGPDDPRGKGPCGGLSENYMRNHPNWLAHCSGSRLIK